MLVSLLCLMILNGGSSPFFFVFFIAIIFVSAVILTVTRRPAEIALVVDLEPSLTLYLKVIRLNGGMGLMLIFVGLLAGFFRAGPLTGAALLVGLALLWLAQIQYRSYLCTVFALAAELRRRQRGD